MGVGIVGIKNCASDQMQNLVNEDPERFKSLQIIAIVMITIRMFNAVLIILIIIYLCYT